MTWNAPTLDDAYEMGATGGTPVEAERLAFEAWMAGHCWKVMGTWDGKTYTHALEKDGDLYPPAMNTRQLWAAWRDRASLANKEAPPQPDWLHLKRFGYAPGFYTNTCRTCGKVTADLDKLAISCRPCAEAKDAKGPRL